MTMIQIFVRSYLNEFLGILEKHSVPLVTVIILLWFLKTIVFPPWNFPKNIPTIPFYVSFLGAYTKLDQTQIYDIYLREKIEKYGAVKVYFASRWNILVARHNYLQQVFNDEDIFAKSGNQKKIPSSVLSEYTGDNIISAHGETWKLYRSIMAHPIQFPKTEPIYQNSTKFIKQLHKLVSAEKGVFSVNELVQRLCLANIGDAILGTDFEALEDSSELHSRLVAIKKQIFKPFFMNFPFFDQFPIPSRQKARIEVKNFRHFYCNILKNTKSTSDLVFNLKKALKEGGITEKQFSDNAVIIMVAGHENPQLLLSSLLYVLAKYLQVQEKLRREILKNDDMSEKTIANLPYLNSVIYETLRLFPPLGQIINRKTLCEVTLGKDISIPKGVYVGYNNYATGRDRNVWSEADNFTPERWGYSIEEVKGNYLKAKRESTMPAFHGKRRACLGEKFALLQMRVVLIDILKNFELSLDPQWEERFTPAGPICPVGLSLKLKSRSFQ